MLDGGEMGGRSRSEGTVPERKKDRSGEGGGGMRERGSDGGEGEGGRKLGLGDQSARGQCDSTGAIFCNSESKRNLVSKMCSFKNVCRDFPDWVASVLAEEGFDIISAFLCARHPSHPP